MLLGHGPFDADKHYGLQTIKDNLTLFTPDIMARMNTEVIRAGYALLDLEVDAMIQGRCDSFVLKTDVHFPTDINLLYDAIRVLIRDCVRWSKEYSLPGWRQPAQIQGAVSKDPNVASFDLQTPRQVTRARRVNP